ncbi:MAG: hypothetical protein K2X11_21850 [Acetobacteraceae bacterium]|nr:hypothetical protein [Acetobacteraceae bacterium]
MSPLLALSAAAFLLGMAVWHFAGFFAQLAAWACGLAVLLHYALPRRWRDGLSLDLLLAISMLVLPVALMSVLAVWTLATKPVVWESFEWRRIEHARLPGETWRHMFPKRPGASGRDPSAPE